MARVKTPGNGTTTRKNVTTMPTPKPVEVRNNAPTENLEDKIRMRAYQLYEERGYLPGHQDEDWLVAEREVLGGNQQQSA